MMQPRYLVIANPDSKRWLAYQRELVGFWSEQGAAPEIQLVPWREVTPRLGNLDDLPVFAKPALVRLESPGRDFDVMKLLLDAGDNDTRWRDLPYRKGQLVQPGLMYRGFCRVLHGLRVAFDARPNLRPLACPLAIAEMFDKRATAARLQAAGLPTPSFLPPLTDVKHLLAEIRRRGWETAYVKLNTGSSATGIAVVHALRNPPWAITSLLHWRGEFFNTRRLQEVSGPELEAVLTFLFREGPIVQEGIAMAQIDGQNFDVRVVMIHGRPAFTVFRLSSGPMTNLHLGGRRGEPDLCRAAIPTSAWHDALDDCTAAARLYPASASVGIDLLFEQGYRRHFLLEVNAFGDFFPGLQNEQGRSVHRVEIEETARRSQS